MVDFYSDQTVPVSKMCSENSSLPELVVLQVPVDLAAFIEFVWSLPAASDLGQPSAETMV